MGKRNEVQGVCRKITSCTIAHLFRIVSFSISHLVGNIENNNSLFKKHLPQSGYIVQGVLRRAIADT